MNYSKNFSGNSSTTSRYMSTWPELDAGNKKEIQNQQVVKTTASDTSVDRLIERVLQKKDK